MSEVPYDQIGRGYRVFRRTDPQIAALVVEALGDARTVLNVGAGAGSYEPVDREVVAAEPSDLMIAQRPPGAAPVVRAAAEELPFEDNSFDAAMAILTDHHWDDRAAGLHEMLRVARRIVLLNADPGLAQRFWLTRDYLPGFIDLIPERYRRAGWWGEELRRLIGETQARPVPVPHDCVDGFYQAYWRRPHAYLDQSVRNGISVFHRLPQSDVSRGMERLCRDLDEGAWEERYRDLCDAPELDVGLRLVTSERD